METDITLGGALGPILTVLVNVEKAVTYCGREPGNKALRMFRYQDGNPKEVRLGYREIFRP